MRVKKLISILVALAMPVTAFAAVEKAELDIKTNSIVIEGHVKSGLAGKEVKIFILNPHDTEGSKYVLADLKNEETFEKALFVSDSVITTDDGKYEYTISMETKDKVGDYQVYIQDDDGETPENKEIYYADDNYKKDVVKKINNETDEITTENAIKAAIKPLALNNALITEVGISNVARIVEEYIKPETEIDGNKIPAVKLDEESPANAATTLTKLIIAEAYNQNKTALVYGESGTDLQTNKELYDFEAEAAFYSAYTNLLNDAGKKLVRDGMLGAGFKSPEDVTKRFCELVILKGVNNAKQDGTAHIATMLTAGNAARLGRNFDSYIAMTGVPKSNVENDLKSRSYTTMDEFITELNRLVTLYTPTGSTGGISTGGSPSSGSVSIPGGFITMDQVNANKDNRSFTDLENVAWAEEAILYLFENGIVSGVGNKRFAPQNSITREQFVVMLVNALGIELSEESTEFSDVVSGSYYSKHIAAARKMGIINGVSESVFGVGKELTRQDICTMIKRACFAGNDAQEEADFIDKADISDYALEAVSYMSEAGIINGFEDGSFAPKKVCTRAQGAKILYETLMIYGN